MFAKRLSYNFIIIEQTMIENSKSIPIKFIYI